MLRIYFLQQWFNLADPAVEEALYDSATLRQFAGIDLGREPVPEETTVCKFRHLLEEHNLGEEILGTVNLHLQARGVRISTGTIVMSTRRCWLWSYLTSRSITNTSLSGGSSAVILNNCDRWQHGYSSKRPKK